MSEGQNTLTKFGFAKTFILPALLVFLIPTISLLFFLHVRGSFDGQFRESLLAQIKTAPNLSPEELAKATELFTKVPVSRLIRDENFAQQLPAEIRTDYKIFRWMINLSAICIASGIVVFLVTGLCVLLSLSSALVQYLSLSLGWHVLRIFGAFQTVAQGAMLVALAYWIPAFFFERFSPKLIFVAGAAAVLAAVAVVIAIFKRPKTDLAVEGKVIDKREAGPLWEKLQTICDKVGTDPPDQVVIGIDDNFFVTEQPVTVDSKKYRGRTLFVSLALLKQLHGSEADAVLAHEMAHFSGKDTLYSKRISPLLHRFGHYLEALYNGGITRPIFYFMNCLRALYEVSLSRLRRQREFRADRIAAETTSSRDVAGALLRVAAYSNYRAKVERELFEHEKELEAANISERIEQGFRQYAMAFASSNEFGQSVTSHPFDTHPTLTQRLESIRADLGPNDAPRLLGAQVDGGWYRAIADAEELENSQWAEFEERFRNYHKQTLPYRYLPETDEERALVVEAFPQISIPGKDGLLGIDYEKFQFTDWLDPVYFTDITSIGVNEGVLQIAYNRDGKQKKSLKMKTFGQSKQEVIDTLNRYYGRAVAAREYQKHKKQQADKASN